MHLSSPYDDIQYSRTRRAKLVCITSEKRGRSYIMIHFSPASKARASIIQVPKVQSCIARFANEPNASHCTKNDTVFSAQRNKARNHKRLCVP